jgi:GDP-4-dehydro-6-deoxy-D-mannose reductase
MSASVLLIGGTGFAGSHAQSVLNQEYRIEITNHTADIRDAAAINRVVEKVLPDYVINFASITTVRESFEEPLKTYAIGFLGTLNLLQALKSIGFRGRLLNISSSEVYGFPAANALPLQETSSASPMSPYAVSKIATEALCDQWVNTEGFEIVTARPFTHIGPGQSDKFAVSSFAKQIAEILLKMREPVIHVGDLQTTRDLTDVRDVVSAYKLLLEKGRNGEIYNVCSGKEVSMLSVVEELVRSAGLPITVRQDELLLRKSEQRRTCGSFAKIREHTGWMPQILLGQTLHETVVYWKDRLKHCKT